MGLSVAIGLQMEPARSIVSVFTGHFANMSHAIGHCPFHLAIGNKSNAKAWDVEHFQTLVAIGLSEEWGAQEQSHQKSMREMSLKRGIKLEE